MTEIVFWLPAINPYWRDRFNALAADGRVDFVCWFNDRIDPARSWEVTKDSMVFPHTFLATKRHSVSRLRELLRLYRVAKPTTIFTFHHDPGLWPVWAHRVFGGHVTLYALMTWDSWVKRTRSKEFAKRIFFSSASSVMTPGPDSDAYVQKYGARRVHRLHHAVDAIGLAESGTGRSPSPVLRLLYVGRLIEEKGLPFLIEVLDAVMESRSDVDVTFVGDGVMSEQLQAWVDLRPDRARLLPFVQADALGGVYSSADVLLFPTKGDPYGLVVDEALATGMPVISSDKAGDISWRLADGRGWVHQEGDTGSWIETIHRLAGDRQLLHASSQRALAYSAGHDVGRWVDEIVAWRDATSKRVSGKTK